MIVYTITAMICMALLMIKIHLEGDDQIDKMLPCLIALIASVIWPFSLVLALMYYGTELVAKWLDKQKREYK